MLDFSVRLTTAIYEFRFIARWIMYSQLSDSTFELKAGKANRYVVYRMPNSIGWVSEVPWRVGRRLVCDVRLPLKCEQFSTVRFHSASFFSLTRVTQFIDANRLSAPLQKEKKNMLLKFYSYGLNSWVLWMYSCPSQLSSEQHSVKWHYLVRNLTHWALIFWNSRNDA